MKLQGASVLITGGRRVGAELARMLAERGARVAMTYRTNRDAIEATLDACRELGADALAVEADLAVPGRAEEAIGVVLDRFERLDALINMASIFERTPFDALTSDHFERMIAANLTAPYYAAVASGKAMRAQRPIDAEAALKGKIINFGDWSTERPRTGYLPYIVAKGGLTTLTLALAKELAPEVAVSLVQPGTILPPPDLSESERASIINATPMGRIGQASDANNLVLYLLEGTDYATGACYRVDGGRFIGLDDEST